MIGSLVMTVALAASSGGSADALAKHEAKTLTIQVPAAWERTVQEGTEKFKAPSGDAFFTLDVGAVQTQGMQAKVCLEKILTAMGGSEGWEKVSLGLNPAARKVSVDDANEEGSEKVRSMHYVGCNGKTTWSLIFSMNDKKKDRFEPLAGKIAQSVSYAKGK
ncbi:hypothetical protein [Hyalangium sp.]|uniref:hypothetical protein n=1 Tax=Hyalangium sp. TaxID=2028555 RepID=UPI002D253453|nr:hypothetical protein [Hyalangium sp.]HYH98099.1 hypothetical protein [Hyalangium sp.]